MVPALKSRRPKDDNEISAEIRAIRSGSQSNAGFSVRNAGVHTRTLSP